MHVTYISVPVKYFIPIKGSPTTDTSFASDAEPARSSPRPHFLHRRRAGRAAGWLRFLCVSLPVGSAWQLPDAWGGRHPVPTGRHRASGRRPPPTTRAHYPASVVRFCVSQRRRVSVVITGHRSSPRRPNDDRRLETAGKDRNAECRDIFEFMLGIWYTVRFACSVGRYLVRYVIRFCTSVP